MAEIETFLNFRTDTPLLSIPLSDIERLAVFPLRWIRYVMFAVCGARGDLSSAPEGAPVDYDQIVLPDGQNTFYYQPSEQCAFIDYEGLNDRLTSTEQTRRRRDFRSDIIRRDGHACVITETGEGDCQASHLIPRSKDDEYIQVVIRLRSRGDDSVLDPNITSINDERNGILLTKNLHSALGRGAVAFIKTPNYGLRPEDIRKFRRGDPRTDYITLHWMQRPENYDPTSLEMILQTFQTRSVNPGIALATGANVDALFRGQGGSLPPTVILDYVYGVAAYKSWNSQRNIDRVLDVMDEYRNAHYAQIPPLPRDSPDDTNGTPGPDGDDPNDPDYIPGDETVGRGDSTDPDFNPLVSRKRYTSTRRDENEMAKAMDELNMFLMRIHGITPEQAAERRQKEIEQEERAAQEASRSKVAAWREHLGTH